MAQQQLFAASGCIVEYLEDNLPQIAMVMEENAGKLRLLLPNRKETKLSSARMLPWLGPCYPAGMSREEAIHTLESHKKARAEKTAKISAADVWELANGEIEQAPASFFAELFEDSPSPDTIAAYGHALLGFKTHFRFQPPEFLVYDRETAEKRQEEKKTREQREALIAGGSAFLRLLCDIALKKRPAPDNTDFKEHMPDAEIAERLEKMLFDRMCNPETVEDENLWQLVARGLPDFPNLPLQMLIAWGKLGQHHNYLLDRAGYDEGQQWWQEDKKNVENLIQTGECAENSICAGLPCLSLPFISIDGPETKDIDDAFYIEKNGNTLKLTLALAAPAIGWEFGSGLDKKVRQRATSIYLPEGDLHMLPAPLGENAFSLLAKHKRPALCIEITIDENGAFTECRPFAAIVSLAANLFYADVQKMLEKGSVNASSPALPYKDQLEAANIFAKAREKRRIEEGAVIMQQYDPKIVLLDKGITKGMTDNITVDILLEEPYPDAQRLVAEMMVLANAAISEWAFQNGVPLIRRTQNITLPPEFAGVWNKPEDMARIKHSLMPSILETAPRRHAALAVKHYAPLTSPLRRYADLLNEAQVIKYLQTEKYIWTEDELANILSGFTPALDAAAKVQRFRPRYWKLLYFSQKGDKVFWNGVITEENETFATVTLPEYGIFIRAKRGIFEERALPGMPVKVRLGKIHPLNNEIQILEALPFEEAFF